MAKKILVIDDQPSITKLVSVKLTKEGFKVIEALDGEEGLNKAKEERPDLIILDVMMPRMDGWEVREKLREDRHCQNIPVIMLTAMGHFEEQLKGLEGGIEDYLTKPFSPAALAGLVKEVLDESVRVKAERAEKKLRKKAKLRTMVDIMQRRGDEEK